MVYTAAEEEGDAILLPDLFFRGGPGLGLDESGHGSSTGLDMDAWAAEPLTADDLLTGDMYLETMTAYLEGQTREEEAEEGARAGVEDPSPSSSSGRLTRKISATTATTTTRRTSSRTPVRKEPGGPTSSALGGSLGLGGSTGSSSSLGSTGGMTGLSAGPLGRGIGRAKGPTLMQHSCEACKLSKVRGGQGRTRGRRGNVRNMRDTPHR